MCDEGLLCDVGGMGVLGGLCTRGGGVSAMGGGSWCLVDGKWAMGGGRGVLWGGLMAHGPGAMRGFWYCGWGEQCTKGGFWCDMGVL